MKEALLILLGYFLGLIQPWWFRKDRISAHKAAIRSEMNICKEKAETLLSDGVASPLYRLPLSAYQNAFPALLADGIFNEDQANAITRYFGKAEEINRGLDIADETRRAQVMPEVFGAQLKQEHGRNCIKANALINELYQNAFNVVKE